MKDGFELQEAILDDLVLGQYAVVLDDSGIDEAKKGVAEGMAKALYEYLMSADDAWIIHKNMGPFVVSEGCVFPKHTTVGAKVYLKPPQVARHIVKSDSTPKNIQVGVLKLGEDANG